jgi:hypothetical protein
MAEIEDNNGPESDIYDDLKSIVPDELPPLGEEGVSITPEPEEGYTVTEASSPKVEVSKPLPTHEAEPSKQFAPSSSEVAAVPRVNHGNNNEQLFFSGVISKFASPELKELMEDKILSLKSNDFIDIMQEKWEQHRELDELKSVEHQILEKMKTLPRLEQEWRALSLSVSRQVRMMKEREELIKSITAELKSLMKQRKDMNGDFEKRRAKSQKNKKAKSFGH